jgi:membrane protease YdiL (CAAX protease family)
MWGFMILIVSGAVLLTWIYNNTRGSILATMLFHTMINLSFFMFPTLETVLGGLYLLVMSLLVALAVVAVFGPKNLVIGVVKR